VAGPRSLPAARRIPTVPGTGIADTIAQVAKGVGLYATPGASAPLLHLRRQAADGLFDRFAGHFEAIWATTTPVDSAQAQPTATATS